MIEIQWDPEVESPATIAILGGGPVGIEAAIYARFLGYFVSIFEERRVAHRMLDWHERPLAVPVSDCTTSLGHAAIAAQNPEYKQRPSHEFYTGRSYAEEYLVPLAKTDLLFDDIHFLSPVADVSRMRTFATDPVDVQERCNDEFRLVVEGRHRGTWTSRADVVLDCRGFGQQAVGMGPGGGQAIGELALRDSFLKHTPCDRKFEPKSILGKKTCLVGHSLRATQFATEFAALYSDRTDTRLTWIVRSSRSCDSKAFADSLQSIRSNQPPNLVIQECLGVEQIQMDADRAYSLRLLRDDDSTVEILCDAVISLVGTRPKHLSFELDEVPLERNGISSFVTKEPGLYVVRGGSLEAGAGVGLKDAFGQIRELFAMLAGREDLDLYEIIQRQQTTDEQAPR
jgi:thioredoxin reductase